MKLSCPLIFALLSLWACDQSADAPVAQSGQPTAPVEAAAPQEPTAPAYYPAGYAEMKVAAAIFAKETYGPRKPDDDDGYGVIDCGEEFDIAEVNRSGDPKQLQLEDFSREMARHQHYLSQLYPAEVYEEPLRDYEKAMLAHIAVMPKPTDYDDPNRSDNPAYDAWEQRSGKLQEELVAALEQRRQEARVGKNPITIGGECGAGETPFLVRTEPADGRVWVATKFSFDLCQARKQDPWNTDRCRWTELSPTEPAYLSGRYVYQVRWRGGKQRRGLRAFDGALQLAEGEEATEVVIRPS